MGILDFEASLKSTTSQGFVAVKFFVLCFDDSLRLMWIDFEADFDFLELFEITDFLDLLDFRDLDLENLPKDYVDRFFVEDLDSMLVLYWYILQCDELGMVPS